MGSLREVRKACGFSQRALAAKVGIRLETVYHIERGTRLPSFAVMRLICEALRVEPQHIDEFREAIADAGQLHIPRKAERRIASTREEAPDVDT
jgi:DNA-binding XRE family transcriptional regulator